MSEEEVKASGHHPADTNGDGKVSKEEEKMSDELVNLITQVVKEVHNQMKEEMSEVKTEIDEIKTEFNEFKTKPAGKKITSNVQQKFSEYDDKVARLIKLGKSLNK